MDRKKIISIQDSQLIKFRNALREVVFNAYIIELETLIAESRNLTIESNLDRIKYLADKMDKLRTAWKISIYTCSLCGSRTSDMVFNIFFKIWFCIECYGKNQKFYRKKGEEGEIWYDESTSHVPSTRWYP